MKKINVNNKFDAVEYMREQKKALAKKLENMTNSEILEYFRKKD